MKSYLYFLLLLLIPTAIFAQSPPPPFPPNVPRVTGGTLLFKEDFGGNDPSEPLKHPTGKMRGAAGKLLKYTTGNALQIGYYNLMKEINIADFWTFEDRTNQGNRLPGEKKGYMFLCDPDNNMTEETMYSINIEDLCEGSDLVLSVWLGNLNGRFGKAGLTKHKADPSVRLEIRDETSKKVLSKSSDIVLHRFEDGCYVHQPPKYVPCGTSGHNKWMQYRLDFTVPAGVTKLEFAVVNLEISNSGNDWAMDDIEVRLLNENDITTQLNGTPNQVHQIKSDAEMVLLEGNYVNEGVFGTDIHTTWIYSPNNNLENPEEWTIISKKRETVAINQTYKHDLKLLHAKVGYYRLVLGNSDDAYKTNCKIASDLIQIKK